MVMPYMYSEMQNKLSKTRESPLEFMGQIISSRCPVEDTNTISQQIIISMLHGRFSSSRMIIHFANHLNHLASVAYTNLTNRRLREMAAFIQKMSVIHK